MKRMIFNSKSENDTEKIAGEIAKKTIDYSIVCLYGELGVGKTTFVKAFLKSLGVRERVISPTYVFIRHHKAKSKDIYHIDAYRIGDSEEDRQSISELLNDNSFVIIIEWAEKIEDILPNRRIDIKFRYDEDDDDSRKIEIVERK